MNGREERGCKSKNALHIFVPPPSPSQSTKYLQIISAGFAAVILITISIVRFGYLKKATFQRFFKGFEIIVLPVMITILATFLNLSKPAQMVYL